jgi:hypothetical protein
LLRVCKRQPTVEKRFAQRETDFEVAPVYVKSVHRIQALLCVHFFALLVEALLERELRQAMQHRKVESLPICPVALADPRSRAAGQGVPAGRPSHGRAHFGPSGGQIVARIGKRAGVAADKARGKTATAHDLRRAFGSRKPESAPSGPGGAIAETLCDESGCGEDSEGVGEGTRTLGPQNHNLVL